jgi:hypothetical protein
VGEVDEVGRDQVDGLCRPQVGGLAGTVLGRAGMKAVRGKHQAAATRSSL